jgi:hypothetical protein
VKRTVTRTATVSISGRETRLRALLEAIASANGKGRRPGKADVTGNVPSRTRANRYRLIDELVRRHLVTPGLDSKGYHLEITAAGREVLEHGTAEAAWEEDEYGEIKWIITEHLSGGVSLTWDFRDRDEALEFRAAYRDSGDDTVIRTVLSQLWVRPGDLLSTAEVLTSETIWPPEGEPQ